MTHGAIYQYKIASGYNQSGSLVNVELIKPTGGTYFYPPDSYGTYDPGQNKLRLNRRLFFGGFASVVWKFDWMTRVQLRYLMTTYCNSGYDGLVTIATKTDAVDTYSNLNAVMLLTKLRANQKNFSIFPHYEITFSITSAAS